MQRDDRATGFSNIGSNMNSGTPIQSGAAKNPAVQGSFIDYRLKVKGLTSGARSDRTTPSILADKIAQKRSPHLSEDNPHADGQSVEQHSPALSQIHRPLPLSATTQQPLIFNTSELAAEKPETVQLVPPVASASSEPASQLTSTSADSFANANLKLSQDNVATAAPAPVPTESEETPRSGSSSSSSVTRATENRISIEAFLTDPRLDQIETRDEDFTHAVELDDIPRLQFLHSLLNERPRKQIKPVETPPPAGIDSIKPLERAPKGPPPPSPRAQPAPAPAALPQHVARDVHDMTVDELDLLSSLKLKSLDGPSIASKISKCKQLTSLELKNCTISEDDARLLGLAFKDLSHLSRVVLSNSVPSVLSLKELLSELSQSKSLQQLGLPCNCITVDGAMVLAAALSSSKNITSLDLSNNELQADGVDPLSMWMKDVHCLKSLNLSNNRLRTGAARLITQVIVEDSTLESLDLSDNGIEDASAAEVIGYLITQNRTLKSLNLSRNYLGTLTLNAIGAALPWNFSLTGLDLSKNSIGSDGVGELAAAFKWNNTLRRLSMAVSRIGPDGLDALARQLELNNFSIVSLDVTPSANPINSPQIRGPVSQIESALARNREIMSGKHRLCLSATSYDSSGELANLFTATHLIVGNSAHISDSVLEKCVHLEILDLSRLGLQVIPAFVSALKNLKKLDLRSNRLEILAGESIASLELLEVLMLSNNKLEFLPVELVHLKNLRELHLWQNPLSQLLNLKSRPLGPSLAAFHAIPFQNSPLAVYLRDLEGSSQRQSVYNRMKLMLLGLDNAGKTTLLNAFEEYTYKKDVIGKHNHRATLRSSAQPIIVRETLSTDGISIREVKMRDDTDGNSTPPTEIPEVVLSVWDFAGQQHYESTHTFFLTAKTMYIVVFSLMDYPNNVKDAIEHWYRTIMMRAGVNAPYIIVGTHLRERYPQRGDRQAAKAEVTKHLRKKFPTVDDVLLIDSKYNTEKYMAKIKKAILGVGKKRIMLRRRLPEAFGRAEARLQSYTTHTLVQSASLSSLSFGTQTFAASEPTSKPGWIPYAEYKRLVLGCGIGLDMLDEVTSFLVSTGQILYPFPKNPLTNLFERRLLHLVKCRYFGDDEKLSDLVFIDPQFLCRVLSDVLSYKSPPGSQTPNGIIPKKAFDTIWSKYPAHLRDKLLRLLENFDIATNQDNADTEEETIMIPALFDPQPPLAAGRYLQHRPDLSMGLYQRIFAFQFITPAFINKLLTRCFQLKTLEVVCFWRNGLIASRNTEIARLEYFPAEYKVVITVIGHKTAALLVTLVSCVDLLIRTWFPKSVVDVLVPLPVAPSGAQSPPSSRGPAPLLRTSSTTDVSSEQFVSVHELSRLISCGGTTYPLPAPPGAFINIEVLAPDLLLNDLARVVIDSVDLGPRTSWKLLGSGAFGAVYSALLRGHEPVAIKTHLAESKLSTAITEEDTQQEMSKALKEFSDEARIMAYMSQIAHPNVVQLRGICKEPLSIVMELVPGGDLHSYLKQHHEISWPLKMRILIDVASGMSHLHRFSPPVVHSDLRSPNILLVSDQAAADCVAKVTDFGLAAQLHSKFGVSRNQSFQWLAPELLLEKPFSHKSDVYSFAMIIYEVWAGHGKMPFDDELEQKNRHKEDIRKEIARNGLRPALAPLLAASQLPALVDLAALIQRCWAFDAEERPEFSTIVRELIEIGKKIPGFDEVVPKLHTDSSEQSHQITPAVVSSSSTDIQTWQTKRSITQNAQRTSVTAMMKRPCSNEVWIGMSDSELRVLDVQTGCVQTLSPPAEGDMPRGASRRITGFAMSPDGKVIWVMSEDKSIRIYQDAGNGPKQVFRVLLPAHPLCVAVDSSSFSPRVYIGCSDGKLLVCDMDAINFASEHLTLDQICLQQAPFAGPVVALFVDASYVFVSATSNGEMKIVEKIEGQGLLGSVLQTWRAHPDRIKSIIKVDNNIWTCGEDIIKVWRTLKSNNSVLVMWQQDLKQHKFKICRMIAIDDSVISAAENLIVWHKNGTVKKFLGGPNGGNMCDVAAFSSNMFVSAADANFNKQDGSRDAVFDIWAKE